MAVVGIVATGETVTNLNAIIVREAVDDFAAFITAYAMQSMAFVDVVSVVCQYRGDTFERWYVFAKYAGDMVAEDQIDKIINLAFEKKSL